MKVRYLIPLMVVGLSLTLPVSVMGQERVDLSTLVKQGDQYLVPGSLDPYTGPFVQYRSPTVISIWGQFRNGYLHGPFERYYENGQLSQKGSFSNGKMDGPWEEYYENGQLDWKGSFFNGEPCGEFIDDGETVTYPPCPNG